MKVGRWCRARARWGGEGLGRAGRVELSGRRGWGMEGGGGWAGWFSEKGRWWNRWGAGAGARVGMDDGAVWGESGSSTTRPRIEPIPHTTHPMLAHTQFPIAAIPKPPIPHASPDTAAPLPPHRHPNPPPASPHPTQPRPNTQSSSHCSALPPYAAFLTSSARSKGQAGAIADRPSF